MKSNRQKEYYNAIPIIQKLAKCYLLRLGLWDLIMAKRAMKVRKARMIKR